MFKNLMTIVERTFFPNPSFHVHLICLSKLLLGYSLIGLNFLKGCSSVVVGFVLFVFFRILEEYQTLQFK